MRARVPGARTARKLSRWLRSRFEPHALVLGYHRIAEPMDDPYGLCTSPPRFAGHLELLRREAHPISLGEMRAALRRGALPRHAVVVTLDDGYSDSLHAAKPVLEAHEVPATVFVTSGLLGREPWWDALARLLGSNAALSSRFAIEVDGRKLEWDPDGQRSPGERGEQIREIQRRLLAWPADARERAIAELGDELGRPDARDPAPRGLEPAELRRLAEGPWIEVGAHSVSHPMLAALSEQEQRYEIVASKRALEELISAPVRSFSYPNGSNSPRTRELVHESGFECACASLPDVASRRSDPFRLPRMWIGDLDVDAFAAWLRRWR